MIALFYRVFLCFTILILVPEPGRAQDAVRGLQVVKIAFELKSLLEELFRASRFPPLKVEVRETEEELELSIVGGPITDYADLSAETTFAGDFWRGYLRFTNSSYLLGGESVGIFGHIFHHAGVARPHPEDALKGTLYTFSETIESPVAGSVSRDLPAETKNHGRHLDRYNGRLAGQVIQGEVFSNHIAGWTFTLRASHTSGP